MINTSAASVVTANMTGEINNLTSFTALVTSKIAFKGNPAHIMNVSENIKNGLIATLTGSPPTEHIATDEADKQ